MNRIDTLRQARRAAAGLIAGGLVYTAAMGCLKGADTNTPAAKPVTVKPAAVPPPKAAAKRALSGAELYSLHCNRCHAERYPNERTSAQWKTIILHMRVRANIPARDARAILRYMQDNSGY
jgi:cytochrome c5